MHRRGIITIQDLAFTDGNTHWLHQHPLRRAYQPMLKIVMDRDDYGQLDRNECSQARHHPCLKPCGISAWNLTYLPTIPLKLYNLCTQGTAVAVTDGSYKKGIAAATVIVVCCLDDKRRHPTLLPIPNPRRN